MVNPAGRIIAVGLLLAMTACSSSHHTVPSTFRAASDPAAPSPARPGAIASAGCKAGSMPEVTNQRATLKVSGATRHYLLTTPPPHRQPDPVIVDFHGYGEGDTTESLTTALGPLGQHDGFLSVFPDGRGNPIAWDTSTTGHNPDLRFVATLLDHLESTQCVDKARIYATGLSMGAFMTSTLACVMSNRFAAFAPVAGVELPTPCRTSRPAPILAFHGTADPILHFNGGIGRAVLADDLSAHPSPLPRLPKARLNGPGFPGHVKAWAAKDGCGATQTDTRLSPHVIHRVYPCPAGVAVDFDIIVGGGHSWPGSAISAELSRFIGKTTMEIKASVAIWSFFQHFHLAHPA